MSSSGHPAFRPVHSKTLIAYSQLSRNQTLLYKQYYIWSHLSALPAPPLHNLSPLDRPDTCQSSLRSLPAVPTIFEVLSTPAFVLAGNTGTFLDTLPSF